MDMQRLAFHEHAEISFSWGKFCQQCVSDHLKIRLPPWMTSGIMHARAKTRDKLKPPMSFCWADRSLQPCSRTFLSCLLLIIVLVQSKIVCFTPYYTVLKNLRWCLVYRGSEQRTTDESTCTYDNQQPPPPLAYDCCQPYAATTQSVHYFWPMLWKDEMGSTQLSYKH
jgi:hypothetical protein